MSLVIFQKSHSVYILRNNSLLWKHLIFVICLFFYLNLPYNDASFLIVGGLLCLFFYLFLAFKEIKASSLWVTPISIFLLWCAINLGLSTAYIGYLNLIDKKILFGFHHIDVDSLINSFKIFSVGIFFFHLGIEKSKPTGSFKNSATANINSLRILFLLSILYYFFNEYFLFAGSLLSPLKFGALAALSIYALTDIKLLDHSFRKKLSILIASCLFLFILNISTMSKEEMMFSFLPLLWFSIKNIQVRKYAIIFLIFLAPFYFLFVAPLSSDLRYQYWKGMEVSTTESVTNVLEGKEKDWDPSNLNKLDVFFMRSAQITPLAFILGEIEKRGFMYGGTLKYLAFSFVPRIFWPNKPYVTQSAWFTYYIGMAHSPQEATSATGITAVGELYWNFGYVGLILGMLLLGLGFGGLWRLAGNPLDGLISMTLYIILLFSMREISEFGSTIVAFVIYYLMFKTLYKIRYSYLNRHKSSRRSIMLPKVLN